MMFPKGLRPPLPDMLRSSPGSPSRPADYPARLPFVPNEACSYGESDSVAMCIWELGTVGAAEHHAISDPVLQLGTAILVGLPVDKEHAAKAWAASTTAPAPAIKRLHELLEAFCAVAGRDGWKQIDAQEPAMPPGARYRRFERDGQTIVAMAVPTPFGQSLMVSCFKDQAA
ncbi:MAG: hypothetical protein WBC97_02285 [Gemmatimonadales bacterium]